MLFSLEELTLLALLCSMTELSNTPKLLEEIAIFTSCSLKVFRLVNWLSLEASSQLDCADIFRPIAIFLPYRLQIIRSRHIMFYLSGLQLLFPHQHQLNLPILFSPRREANHLMKLSKTTETFQLVLRAQLARTSSHQSEPVPVGKQI